MHGFTQRTSFNPLLALVLAAASLVSPIDASAYQTSGYKWSNTNVSYSYPADGMLCDDGVGRSNFIAHMACGCTQDQWQRELARALQAWALVTPLNFRLVSDNGSNWGTSGSTQGDSKFGDSRVTGFYSTNSYIGYAYYPGGGTGAGDVFFNTRYGFKVGGTTCSCSGSAYPIYQVAVHEVGHTLGLGHSTVANALMYPTLWGQGPALDPDDVAGMQAIYGSRRHDSFDNAGSNDTLASASTLSTAADPVNATADITTLSDVDCYRITMPASGALQVKVLVSQTSLLAPKLMVYDANGTLLGSATGDYGKDVTVNVASVSQGAVYNITVMGDTANTVPAVGGYKLYVDTPAATTEPPTEPPTEPTPTPKPPRGKGRNK